LSTGGQTRGSILGGVLLILLGVLFLFARWDPNLQIWHVIWHYWPVLIILWGFAKLLDHLTAQQEGRARPPLVTGSEAALLVLVILAIAGMGLYSRIRERHPDIDLDLNMFHEQARTSMSRLRRFPPVRMSRSPRNVEISPAMRATATSCA
jgi:hypothetical protein